MRVQVLQPDINKSEVNFSVDGEDIRFGLAAIKNVGKGAIDIVLAERNENGDFSSLHEFCRRVCDSSVNKSTIECLIRTGAFDLINKNRAQLLFVLEDAMGQAARAQKDKKSGQENLFGDTAAEEQAEYLEPKTLPQVAEFSRDELLALEKDLLGLYISDHPLLQFREKLEKMVNTSSEQLKEKAEKADVVIGGVISRVRKLMTKKNDPMAFVTIEDLTGPIDVVVFPSTYKECLNLLVEDNVVIIKGKANHRERVKSDNDEGSNDVGVICESITSIASAQNGNGNGNGNGAQKSVNIKIEGLTRDQLMHLRDLLGSNQGESPVYLHTPHNGSLTRIDPGFTIDPSPKLLANIDQLAGREVVWVE